MKYSFTKIIRAKGMGLNPASINRKTGVLYLNHDLWDTYPNAYKEWILCHEEGHLILNTKNELIADEYASSKYLGSRKRSLKNSVYAMEDLLFDFPEHKQRKKQQLLRSLSYDYVVYGTKRSLTNYKKLLYDNR